jgi:RNA polymerase sigma factor (TIGR02999 family)
MCDVTRMVRQIEQGDPFAADELLPLVYDELRKLAAAKLARESPQTLQPTALVHEAYLRLIGGDDWHGWDGRRHFFAAAAEAMRRILIERARRRAALKHGGEFHRIELGDQLLVSDERATELIALDEALAWLELHDPMAAEVVKLRYFVGLSHQETALALNISRRAADRLWALAKARLFQRMTTG